MCITNGAERLVCFAHGKESGPWGTKIAYLSKIAHAKGFRTISPDYRFSYDPEVRVRHLREHAPAAHDGLVLAGSSMGGYVSAFAAADIKPDALFLMAPALYMPGYDGQPPDWACDTVVVHGWHDDIIPVDHSLRFARERHAEFHVLPTGHTLNDQLKALGSTFSRCLDRVIERKTAK